MTYKSLKADCEKCFGLCCVGLYFSKSEGFPADKEAGKPCINLQSDFKCSVHNSLRERGLKGCTAYDCFGAGQKVAQVTFDGEDWNKSEQISNEMFDAFLIVRQLHEMLWYLTDALKIGSSSYVQKDIEDVIEQTDKLTYLKYSDLKNVNIDEHRAKVNKLLLNASDFKRAKVYCSKKLSKANKAIPKGLNAIGADFRNIDLIGANLRGTLLIAADLRNCDLSGTDLIGVDMRDADIRGANLENSIYVTQQQINAAKGNMNTKLPENIVRPFYWEK